MPDAPPPLDLDVLRRNFETVPHSRTLGIRVVTIRRGACTLCLDYDARLVGNPETGFVHGGVVTTLLDTAGGLVTFSSVPAGTAVATLDLRIDYLRPATPGSAIFASAECYKLTRNVAFVRGQAYHGEPADPIASCVATFMLGSAGYTVGAKG